MLNYRNYKPPVVLPNNMKQQNFHVGQVQFHEQGNWRDIDTELKPVGSEHWEMNKAPYSVLLPKHSNRAIHFGNRKHRIRLKPVCNQVEGELNKPWQVLYRNAFAPGTHLECSVGHNSFRKEIVIDEKPDTGLEFRFEMDFDNVCAFGDSFNARENIADFKGKKFNRQFQLFQDSEVSTYFRKAKAWDANGDSIPIELKFKEVGNRLYLIKFIPIAFLRKAVYPVRTDDTTSYYTGAGDGHVYKTNAVWDTAHDAVTGTAANPTYSYGRAVSRISGGDHYIFRLFCPVGTTGLPDSAEISDATFNLECNNITDSYGTQNYALVQTTQASPTTLISEDFNQCGAVDAPTEGAPRVVITATGLKTWTLDATGRGWIDKTGYTKLGIRSGSLDCDDVASTEGVQESNAEFRTSEYNGNDPYLSVTYTYTPTPGGVIMVM